jgi:hypothetical protein
MYEQGMKSSLATVSVAVRILIRFLLLLIIFSQKSSSSKAGFLEALFGLSIVGNAIVGRSDKFSLLGKDLLPGPFLLPVLLSFVGILRSTFVLLRSHLLAMRSWWTCAVRARICSCSLVGALQVLRSTLVLNLFSAASIREVTVMSPPSS